MPSALTSSSSAWMLLVVMALAGCAHAQDPWRADDRAAAVRAALDDPARICQVRVESAFEIPVEAAYRAEGLSLKLGRLNPGHAIEFGVRCAAEFVSIYLVIPRESPDHDVWVRPQRVRVELDGLTRVTLRPRPGRGALQSPRSMP